MLHHAARVSKRTVLTFASTPEHANTWSSSPFTTALQTAAARAWTRTAARNLRNISAPVPVTLQEEGTSQTRKPFPDVPSDSDSGYWLSGRQISSSASRNSSSTRIEGDPLVDRGESSSTAIRSTAHPTTPLQPTPHSPSPVQQVDLKNVHPITPNLHISPETTEARSRTPIQKSRRCIPYSRGLAGLPDSTSPLDLLDNLDKWRRRPPKPDITPFRRKLPSAPTKKPPTFSFETLHSYHNRFPAFQTHQSFRVLVEIAINETKFKAVRHLWVEMDRKGMLSDWDSLDDGGVSLWTVWVRWMVRQGKWVEAWKTIQRWRAKMAKLSGSELASGGLPHAIWVEFLGRAYRWADRSPSSGSSSRRQDCSIGDEPPNAPDRAAGGDLSQEERFMLLMRQPPHRNRSQITNVRPRTIYALVRARLRLGDREWSLDVIRRWFEQMGSEKAETDTKGNRACFRLLNLYLALAFPLPNGQRATGAGIPKGFGSVRKMDALVKELTKLNPRVKPNSTTVLLLLRHLQPTADCADNGVRLVTRYKKLYGDEVDDGRVRLRLARLAVKQNNPTVFRKALASKSMPGGSGWNGATLARSRARLMRERASWLYPEGGMATPKKIGKVRGTGKAGDLARPPV